MSTNPSPSTPTVEPPKPLISVEGLNVLHLYYHIDHGLWRSFSAPEQAATRQHFAEVVRAVRAHPRTQLLIFSVLTAKADLGFMLLTPDLHDANRFEKELTLALGPELLQPAYSYYSMTELSEYTTPEEEYKKQLLAELQAQQKHSTEMVLSPNDIEGSEDFDLRLNEWRQRIQKYNQDRLYPNMALDWPIVCFYPMSKKRDGADNWYSLDFATRRELMSGHAKVGRQWHGKIRQLITGSTGLDDMEWGVTLLAQDVFHVKGVVYQMRFDEVSAKYAEFGEFYIGIQLPVDELLKRVQLA